MPRKADRHSEITASSGNVFADLGLKDAEERLLKSEVVFLIRETVNALGLTQAEAAGKLGITQPKVSNLMSGKLAGFSLEKLFHFLMLLGQDIEIKVRKKPASRPRGRVSLRSDAATTRARAC